MNNYTHLTLTDRCTIERCLSNGYSFKEVAGLIGRHTSTVSREIQNHRTFIKSGQHPCANFSFCRKNSVCGNDSCTYYCKSCKSVDCSTMCDIVNIPLHIFYPKCKPSEESALRNGTSDS